LLITGVPQGFLFVLALYIFTRTNTDIIKYVIQSLILIVVTYLLRFLPINLGVHTMLILLALIILFMAFNKVSLAKFVNAIVSVVIIAIIIIITELLNVLFLDLVFGQAETNILIYHSSPLIKSLSEIPSNAIFALIILASYFVLAKIDKNKKVKNGAIGAKNSE
jgi:uncharacterized membrane protein (UPF0136 family)